MAHVFRSKPHSLEEYPETGMALARRFRAQSPAISHKARLQQGQLAKLCPSDSWFSCASDHCSHIYNTKKK